MHVKRRLLPNFESCSVALFASLALGSTALPARAQGGAPSTRSIASTPSTAPAALLRLTRRAESTSLPAPRHEAATPVPDGSISSPGFDESLK